MDITSPLGQDEVLPVLRHREVSATAAATGSAAGAGADAGSGKKSKKSKEEKEGKKEKKEKKEKKADKAGGGAVVDLLSLDGWGSPAAPASAPAPAPAAAVAAAAAPASGKASKSAKPSKAAWSLVATDRGVSVFASFSASSSALTVALRAVNNNPEGSRCSVEVVVGSAGGINGPGLVSLGAGIAPSGGEGSAVATCTIPGPLVSTAIAALPATVRVGVEGGLVGSDVRSTDASLRVSLCAGFVPHKVGPDDFAALLGKKAGQWGEAKVKVPVPAGAKAKAVLKSIGLFLRAHCVEEEVTKAASFAAKTPASGGGSVCALAKCGKDGSYVSVEVKALCAASKQESQAVAEAVCAALSGATL